MVRRGAYTEIGQAAWSYDTMIRGVLPDRRSIGNVTKYSSTTSRHQSLAGVHYCDVLIDDVPRSTDDLAALFQKREERGGQG